jgi:ribose transport system permease protein
MSGTSAAAPTRVGRPFPAALREAGGRLLAVLLLGAALALCSDTFLTAANIVNVLRQTSLLFILASGLTVVVITAGLDLSVGANIALSACLAGLAMKAGGSPLAGVAAGLGTGALVGLLNGLMVSLLRIPSFIATYGMLWVLQGIAYAVMGGEAVYGFPQAFRMLGVGRVLGVPLPVLGMLALLVLGTLLLRRTVWGHQIYAVGANAEAARLSGVPVRRRLILVYLGSGLAVGFASLVFLARLNSAEADIGDTLTLPAIAAVLIGGTSLFGGVGSLFGSFIGALLLTLVLNGMNLLDVSANWQPLVTGTIVLLAVWLDLRTRRASVIRT